MSEEGGRTSLQPCKAMGLLLRPLAPTMALQMRITHFTEGYEPGIIQEGRIPDL